jgi:hypothetical protein
MPGMSRRAPSRPTVEAHRHAGQHLSVSRGADAVTDLRVRLAHRDGVAAVIYRALNAQRCLPTQTYWMWRWTGLTYHVHLTTTGGGPVVVEMFLPGRTSELVLASSADGKMTTQPRALAEWL